MKLRSEYKRIVLVLVCLLISISYSQGQPKSKKPIQAAFANVLPLDPAVVTGKLPNGFTYYIRHNEKPKDKVLMYLVTKAGSILEDNDQQGLAHYMEHMSFNGTTHFPKNELVNSLQKIGVRFGNDLNAYTSFDETVYQLPIPTDKPEFVKMGLEIMRDWAHEATLDPKEIDDERGVILEEKRLGKGVGDRMSRQYYPMLLNNSRYSNRLPIGMDSVLNNFKPETIRRFYNDWYRPDLQALIVVGNIDVKQMEQSIKAQFSNLKNPANEKVRTNYRVQLTGNNQFLQVTDKEMTSTQAQIFIKNKESIIRTTEDYHNTTLTALFNLMMRVRIQGLLQQADPPFLGGSAGIGSFLGGLDAFTVSVAAKPGQMEQGVKALWREILRVKKYGFTPDELQQAKANFLKPFETSFREKDKTDSKNYVQEYQQYFLKGNAAPGIAFEYQFIKNDLNRISLTDFGKLLNNYLKDIDRDILILASEKDKDILPNEQTFNRWLTDIQNEDIKPYQEEFMAKTLLKVQPKPGKIVGEVKDPVLGITTYTLSNGIKVILKKTDFKNDEVYFRGMASGGNSLYPYDSNTYPSVSSAHMITGFGLGNYNPTQLRKYLAGKTAQVAAIIEERRQYFTAYVVNKDMAVALEQVYATFMEPRIDTALFKGRIASMKAMLVNRLDNPAAVFSDTVIAVMSNHDPRRIGINTLEKINKINLDKAFEIYKERFADASGYTFVFTGSIDTLTLKPLLEKYLASLPNLNKYEQYIDLQYHTPRGIIERTVYAGKEQKATVSLTYTGKYTYNFENNLKLDALREVLGIRMTERLREEESGVYSPQVVAGGSPLAGGYFNLVVQFGCGPQNVDKLISSVKDEIRKLKLNGPTQVNLDKFKAEDAKALETKINTNSYWTNYFDKQVMYNDNLGDYLKYEKVLKSITIDDVKQMANQYLTGENIIKMVLMPEKTTK